MLILGFLFTIIVVFIICRLISKKQYLSKEKPIWKKLVYWAGILFISVIFNMMVYATVSYSFKFSIDLRDENVYIFIWLLFSYLIIQSISPSLFWRKFYRITKTFFTRSKSVNSQSDRNESNLIKETSSFKKNHINEKDFELFLNTLCWLSFSFVIFISLFSVYISTLVPSLLSKYEGVQKQLNQAVQIMTFFTLPIALRQIMFYLNKLKNPSMETTQNLKYKSLKYERFILVQQHLKKLNKNL